MSDARKQYEQAFESYLDDTLDVRAREQLERTLDRDWPEWRTELRRQQQIDRSLRQSFAIPLAAAWSLPDEATPAQPTETRPQPRPKKPQRTQPRNWGNLPGGLAPLIALAIFTATVTSVAAWSVWTSGRSSVKFRPQDLDDVYHQVARGDWPVSVKTNQHKEFVNAFHYRQGQALDLQPLPANVQVNGLACVPALSPFTTVLIAEADRKPVIVVIERQVKDHPQPSRYESLFGGDKLYVHRHAFDNLVAYEVSPWDHPLIAPKLVLTTAQITESRCEDEVCPKSSPSPTAR